jgi:predicted peptidase
VLPGIHLQLLPPDDLRYTIAIPEGYTGDQPVPLILALHYGGQVTPFYGKGVLVGLVEPALRDLGAIIIAPDSVAGDWANPRSEANLLALLDAIQVTYNVDPQRTLITGYSMGGMGTWYLAARHPERFRAAIPVAGRPQEDTIDFEWRIPLYAIHSRDDEVVPLAPTEATATELRRKGVDVTLVVVDGITHFDVGRFVSHLKEAVPWIQNAWKPAD